jgi:hypothetical protein
LFFVTMLSSFNVHFDIRGAMSTWCFNQKKIYKFLYDDLNWCQSLEMAHLMCHLLLTKTSQRFIVIFSLLNGQINNMFLRFKPFRKVKTHLICWNPNQK